MKVFKFGGASVKNAEAIRNVASILERYREELDAYEDEYEESTSYSDSDEAFDNFEDNFGESKETFAPASNNCGTSVNEGASRISSVFGLKARPQIAMVLFLRSLLKWLKIFRPRYCF